MQRQASQAAFSTRMSRLGSLNGGEMGSLWAAEQRVRPSRARSELLREGEPVREPRALLNGYAYRQRLLIEGQRQIVSFLLPGDLIGACRQTRPRAGTTVLTLTDAATCPVPEAPAGSALADAYARSSALEDHYLVAQVTRIGRLDAYQRIADWLLETCDRLMLVGLATPSEFFLPLTQEVLADTLGLTSVHVNRMLQAMRRDELLELRSGSFAFPDRAKLEKLVDYKPAEVSYDG